MYFGMRLPSVEANLPEHTSEKMPIVRDVFTISMSVLTFVTFFKLENAGDVFHISATRSGSIFSG